MGLKAHVIAPSGAWPEEQRAVVVPMPGEITAQSAHVTAAREVVEELLAPFQHPTQRLRAISSARQGPADEEDEEHPNDGRDPDQGRVILSRLRQQIRSPDVDEEAGEERQNPRQQTLGQPEK